jgi:hypothetical protein
MVSDCPGETTSMSMSLPASPVRGHYGTLAIGKETSGACADARRSCGYPCRIPGELRYWCRNEHTHFDERPTLLSYSRALASREFALLHLWQAGWPDARLIFLTLHAVDKSRAKQAMCELTHIRVMSVPPSCRLNALTSLRVASRGDSSVPCNSNCPRGLLDTTSTYSTSGNIEQGSYLCTPNKLNGNIMFSRNALPSTKPPKYKETT